MIYNAIESERKLRTGAEEEYSIREQSGSCLNGRAFGRRPSPAGLDDERTRPWVHETLRAELSSVDYAGPQPQVLLHEWAPDWDKPRVQSRLQKNRTLKINRRSRTTSTPPTRPPVFCRFRTSYFCFHNPDFPSACRRILKSTTISTLPTSCPTISPSNSKLKRTVRQVSKDSKR